MDAKFLNQSLMVVQSRNKDFSPVQPEKACFPIDVTLLGILMEVKLVQPEKALSPIDVTLLGISMEVRPVQP